jgi:hypothetical protein
VQPFLHTRLLPLDHPPVAGRAVAEAELERQMSPLDPRVEDEENPLQRRAIIEPPSTRLAKATLDLRQLRLDSRPQLRSSETTGHEPGSRFVSFSGSKASHRSQRTEGVD